jgi:tetratricopeptide (TPR) repeat protein
MGKTQTAVEYAHWHSDEYDYIFWASAASREALVSSYVTIAGLLKLPQSAAQDQTLAVDAIKRWFSSNQRWLLILDNADDLAMVREFIPSGKSGHVLLTTRAGVLGPIARRVEILEMGTDEGALFLLRRAKNIAEDASLDAAVEADQARAKEITTQLDGLPLALDQAGAYIEETSCGLSGYLSLYREHAPELLRRRGVLASDHPDPVASTWALSFENIEKASSAAAELLRFCAFLHPDGIPEEVFSKGAPELGPVLGLVGSDAFGLNNAIAEILKYSLLRRDPNARILEIHRLVQAALKQGMDEATQRLWAECAVRAVDRAFSYVEFSTWALCERLLGQAYACAQLIDQWRLEFPEAANLLNKAGSYLHARGQYTQAEPLHERALSVWERALGPEHPDVATSLNNLAVLYRAQGQYGKAESLYQRALAIDEKSFGPEHPEVATDLNNLAFLLRNTGRVGEAEPLMRRALKIDKKSYGPEHPRVAIDLNNLAQLLKATNRLGEAEPLMRRALEIDEKSYGPEPSRVAIDLNNLALLLQATNRLGEAEPLMRRALEIDEKSYGPEHPDVAQSLNNLAALYRAQGQYGKAEPLYQRALAIWEKALGPEHPDVALSLNDLALLYYNQGQYAKAEPLYGRALAIWEKALGPEHPDVAPCLEIYALLLRAIGRPEEAAPLEARARTIRGKHA